MKKAFTVILAALMMLGCASCMTNSPYDYGYSAAPADTVSPLNMR